MSQLFMRRWAASGFCAPTSGPSTPEPNSAAPAVTVLLQPGDNWMFHVAAEQVQEGDVIVAGCTTESEDGFFGELLATSLDRTWLQGSGHRRRRPRRRRPREDGLPGVLPRHQRQGHRQGHPRFGEYSRRGARTPSSTRATSSSPTSTASWSSRASWSARSLTPARSAKTTKRAKRQQVPRWRAGPRHLRHARAARRRRP